MSFRPIEIQGIKEKNPTTYTLKFVCLASNEAKKPPSSVKEPTNLSNAGLGDKSITFFQSDEPIYSGVLEKYPQLTDVGGFELLMYQRGGGEDSGFHGINPPHTVSRLKDLCGQSKIYVRPLQQSIQLASSDKESESASDESSSHVLTQVKDMYL